MVYFHLTWVAFTYQDVGGPYRDTMTTITREIESSHLPLFVPCTNSRVQIGRNRDVWVPGPVIGTPLEVKRQLEMYEFVGKLMGLAIRSLNYHSFHFSAVVWKPLVWDTVTERDVLAVDALAFRPLEIITASERKYSSERARSSLTADSKTEKSAQIPDEQGFNSALHAAGIRFTVPVDGGKGPAVELVPGGAKMKITWSNRKEYVR